jgi:hypothetical protein
MRSYQAIPPPTVYTPGSTHGIVYKRDVSAPKFGRAEDVDCFGPLSNVGSVPILSPEGVFWRL